MCTLMNKIVTLHPKISLCHVLFGQREGRRFILVNEERCRDIIFDFFMPELEDADV